MSKTTTSAEKAPGRYVVDSVARACDILRSFASAEEQLTLTQIAGRTGLNPSRAFRLLRTLEHSAMVEKTDVHRYRLRMVPLAPPAFRIGFAAQTPDSAFARAVAEGVRRAAAERNLQLIEVDNRLSARTALRNADRLIRERVDLAIEFQTHAEAAPAIAAKFREAGTPLIAIDIPHPGALFFGADNYRAGLIAGRALGRWTKQNWSARVERLLLLGMKVAGPLTETRLDGVLAGLEEQIEIDPRRILRLEGGGRFQTGLAAARRALEPGKRTLIAGINDPSTLGALHAAEEAGMADCCAAVSQGASAEGRRELRRPGSRLIGSVGYFPERYGEQILKLALDALAGKPTPPATFVEHELITVANVDLRYAGDPPAG